MVVDLLCNRRANTRNLFQFINVCVLYALCTTKVTQQFTAALSTHTGNVLQR